jgi:hypothetical protein
LVAPTGAVPGSDVPFQVSGTNAESWNWSSDGLVSSEGNTAIYNWNTATSKEVTATARNVCGTTSVSTQINIEHLQMAKPKVVPVVATSCGGGAQYKVDLTAYADIDILTGFVWTVTKAGTPIHFDVLGDRGSVIQFQYTGSSAQYSVQAVAVGVGKSNSELSDAQTITAAPTTPVNAKLHGFHIYDVAKSGAYLAQRRANIEVGGSYPYYIYDGGAATTLSWLTPAYTFMPDFDFPAFANATYLWNVDDPHGLLTNASAINGSTAANINLTFGEAINGITGGGSRTIMLSCVVTINSCSYPLTFPIVVQDKFACGTGGYTTVVMGTTEPFGDRTSQRSYETYTFPTSVSDPTPRCWMIEDSAEGTNNDIATIGCRGSYATLSDNSSGFHYASGTREKDSACPPGWRLPRGDDNYLDYQNSTSEIGLHFANLQTWNEYKKMWFKNFTHQHGYICNIPWYRWHIWVLEGTGAWDHEAWISRDDRQMAPNGNASHESFSARCVKEVY